MGTLRDEVYEKLDYLSQLTEVVIGPQNEVLAAIPDRMELTVEQVWQGRIPTYSRVNSYELNLSNILLGFVPKKHHSVVLSLIDCFEFDVSPDFQLNMDTKTMQGTIAIVKKQQQIDEKRVLKLAVDSALGMLNNYEWPNKRLRERAITVMNTLEEGKGHEWAKGHEGRVSGAACREIQNLLKDVILENKWRVRDAEVIQKMGSWIQSYMAEKENGLGLVNLLKLKMMVSRDLPVYSIDEVKHGDPT